MAGKPTVCKWYLRLSSNFDAKYRYNFRDGKDQGANVRERAKQLVSLLQDEDRLRSEREKSLKNKVGFFIASFLN